MKDCDGCKYRKKCTFIGSEIENKCGLKVLKRTNKEDKKG